jgi:hypothetical protein
MFRQPDTPQKPLYLTEEEAMALLEMCLLSQAQTDSIHSQALLRVSNLCRGFLHAPSTEPVYRPILRRPAFVRGREAVCYAGG